MRIRNTLKSVALLLPHVKRLYEQRARSLKRAEVLATELSAVRTELWTEKTELSTVKTELSGVTRRAADLELQVVHSKKVERELFGARSRARDLENQLESALKLEVDLQAERDRAIDLEQKLTIAQRLEVELKIARQHATDLESQLLRSRKLERDLSSTKEQLVDLQKQLELKKTLESQLTGQREQFLALEARFKASNVSLQDARSAFSESENRHEEAEGNLLLERQNTASVEWQLGQVTERNEFLDGRLRALSGNYRIHKSDVDAGGEAQELEAACNRMKSFVELAGEEFVPSKFWEFYYRVNLQQLTGAGLHNFKLTVSQNYHNYLIGSVFDSKLRRLLTWLKNSAPIDAHLLFSTIEDPDYLDQNHFQSHPNHQIFNSDRKERVLYRGYVTLLWEFLLSKDRLALAETMSEPELGNPIRVIHRGKLISQDLATSIFEANDIVPALIERVGEEPCGILEIGAGYGRLAHVLRSALNVRRYVIVDIPPALFVSQWYLSRLYPDATLFGVRDFADWRDVEAEMSEAQLIFLLPHQLSLLPDDFVDAALSISSLHEMLPKQANWYLSEMGRTAKHLIYSKQYWKYINPHDDLEFDASQYDYPPNFEEVVSKEDEVNHLFFNKVFLQSGIED